MPYLILEPFTRLLEVFRLAKDRQESQLPNVILFSLSHDVELTSKNPTSCNTKVMIKLDMKSERRRSLVSM